MLEIRYFAYQHKYALKLASYVNLIDMKRVATPLEQNYQVNFMEYNESFKLNIQSSKIRISKWRSL